MRSLSKSLRVRATATAILTVGVVVIANGAFHAQAIRNQQKHVAEQGALSLTRDARLAIATAFDNGHIEDPGLLRMPGIDRLQVIDVGGRIVFDSKANGIDPSAIDDPSLRRALRSTEPSLHTHSGERWVLVSAPERDYGLALRVSYAQVVSPPLQLWLGLTAFALLSTACAAVIAGLVAGRVEKSLERLAAGAQEIADGRYDHELTVDPIDSIGAVAEKVNYMATTLRDNIAQLERSNLQLETANRHLTELDQTKSDLLANVSHELRTPLTAIKGYTDYLLERKLGAVNPGQRKGLLVVQRNLDRLSRSIDALLDYSRLEVGQISLNIRPFSLPLLADQVLQTLRSIAEEKRILLSAPFPENLPDVMADRERLSQVLENLFVNALKFTPEGGSVSVAAEVREGKVEVSVIDSGIGIAEEHRSRIFDRFHQVDPSSRRLFGGVGLGLAIVKSILDAHAVPIEVESTPGQGTVFRFALPVASEPDTDTAISNLHAL
jgi:signal transduction histidine kinase